MRFAVAALALLPAAALGVTITGPSETSYWVQNASNVITWSLSPSDPNVTNIIVTNADNTTLNGAFSIAQFVPLSTQFFTVTNVTLKVGDKYNVVFVNPQNVSQVLATSPVFPVKVPGTALAPTAASGPSATGSAAGGNATRTASGTGAPSPSNSTHSAALPTFDLGNVQGTMGILAASGIAAFCATIL